MQIKELAENVYYAAGAFFMFYVVTGSEKTVLIELGVSQLVPQIRHDFKEAFPDAKIDKLIALHGHFDHAGSASRWKKELPEIPLVGAKAASDALNDPDKTPGYRRSMKFVSSNPFFKDVFPEADDVVYIEPVEFDEILVEGDVIDLGGQTLEVIETPGHSDCSLTLFHPESGTSFVSDACGLPLPSGRIWPTAFVDKDVYKNSINKIMALDAAFTCMGHSMPYRGQKKIRRLLEKNIEATDGFFEKAGRVWKETGDKKEVLKALYDEYEIDKTPAIAWVIEYGNKVMASQVMK